MTGHRPLLVVHHSASGHTAALARAVAAGAAAQDSGVALLAALDATPDAVRACGGIVLCTPENLGYMSGGMKLFLDRIYYPCLEVTAGLPCALVVRAGTDGTGALAGLRRILTGLRWREVQEPLLVVGEFEDHHLAQAHDLGATLAAGLACGLY